MNLLFSYGTLQLVEVQQATFGRRLHGERDVLPGHELAAVPIGDPQVIASTGRTHHDNVVTSADSASAVAGMVFEVTDGELAAADEFERPAEYTRRLVTLASGKRAWVYAHTPR